MCISLDDVLMPLLMAVVSIVLRHSSIAYLWNHYLALSFSQWQRRFLIRIDSVMEFSLLVFINVYDKVQNVANPQLFDKLDEQTVNSIDVIQTLKC